LGLSSIQAMEQHVLEFRDRFLKLATINIVSNLMVPLAGLIDTAFLGHLQDIRHLAGVAIATVLFNYLYWSFGFLRMGTTGLTAQADGRQDWSAVLLIGLRHGLLAIGVGCLIVIAQVPLRELGFTLLSATPEVKESGEAYYNALIWGAPANLLNFVLLGWFLGRGKGKQVLLLSLVVNGCNVVLDYWFIVRWGWESAGAGWATAASQLVMALVGWGLVAQEVRWKDITPLANHILDPQALRQAIALNGDILIRTFVLVSTFSLFTNLSSALGTLVLASNTLLLQVIGFASYFIDGLAFATESFAGLFRGQGKPHLLISLLWLSGSLSFGMGIVFATVLNSFPNPIFGLLTNHNPVIQHLLRFTPWLFPVLGFGAIAYLLDGYFLGLTEGRRLRNASLLSTLVGFLPLGFLAAWTQSEHLLWLAMAVFMATRVLTLGWQLPATLQPDIRQTP
jgi:MATE family multidrug resistance protein